MSIKQAIVAYNVQNDIKIDILELLSKNIEIFK